MKFELSKHAEEELSRNWAKFPVYKLPVGRSSGRV